jgi:hypothetical protein
LNLSIRGIRGQDDDSSRINAIVEFEATDRIQLFFVGNTFTGGNDTEYGSLLNYTMMLGLSYTH